jgi:hydrogenase expression/formation protein HypC
MCLGVPGEIVEITNDEPLARTGRVSFSGLIREINLAYVPEAVVGDYVIVHAGFAIARVDEREAAEIMQYLHDAYDDET